MKKGKATSEHLHLCYGSKMAIRTIHKYLFKHLRFFKRILDFRCLKKLERNKETRLFEFDISICRLIYYRASNGKVAFLNGL